MDEKNSKLAYSIAFFVAMLWGTSAAVSKLVLTNLSFWNVQLYTLAFTSVFLFVVILFQKKTSLLKSISIQDLFWMAFIGFLGKFLYGNLFYIAIGRLPTQEAFIINYLWPLMVVISASFILKEKLTVFKYISLILSFFAVILVATKGDFNNIQLADNFGVLCAFLGAISYGVYSSLSKKRNFDPLIGNFMFTLFGFILTAISMPFFDKVEMISINQFYGLLWLGPILSLGAVMWLKALKIGDTSKVSNMIYFTPFFSLFYISLLLGEQITTASILGLFILVFSNFVSLINVGKKSSI